MYARPGRHAPSIYLVENPRIRRRFRPRIHHRAAGCASARLPPAGSDVHTCRRRHGADRCSRLSCLVLSRAVSCCLVLSLLSLLSLLSRTEDPQAREACTCTTTRDDMADKGTRWAMGAVWAGVRSPRGPHKTPWSPNTRVDWPYPALPIILRPTPGIMSDTPSGTQVVAICGRKAAEKR